MLLFFPFFILAVKLKYNGFYFPGRLAAGFDFPFISIEYYFFIVGAAWLRALKTGAQFPPAAGCRSAVYGMAGAPPRPAFTEKQMSQKKARKENKKPY
jgi:hypothetical protein